MRIYYEPTAEHLERLSGPWSASYSGGKDSTALVTWLEWLRRAGWIDAPSPRLVRSDTGVEEPNLLALAEELTCVLRRCGWECALVRPPIHKRLYNRILGVGLTPVHPAIRRMRWCTNATKIYPMDAWRKTAGALGLQLTGLREGESAMRDDKIRRSGCAAGGECGIPLPGEGRYSPILRWKTCQVVDWLAGRVAKDVCRLMADVSAVTSRLVDLYSPLVEPGLYGEDVVEVAARFGCVGCPAIGEGPGAPAAVRLRYGEGSPLCELYDVWHEARLPAGRLVNLKRGSRLRRGKTAMAGPLRMEVRKRLFARVMDIQRRAGVVLVTPEDEAFIRDCWARKVYPKGWCEADELTQPPEPPLFALPRTW